MAKLTGKTALVTGATIGIGRASAIRLAEEGARVVVTGRNPAAGEEVVAEITANGGEAEYFELDVTREAEWTAAMDGVMSTFGRLDILVNNAGTSLDCLIEETTLDEWRRIMAINLDSVFLGTKHAIPVMRQSGGGSIINMSSVLGITGAAQFSAYTASKGAVRLFTKCAALECAEARNGIRVNSIHPAFIDTPMMRNYCIRVFGDVETGKAELGKLHPVGHVGDPVDVAHGVLYLASDESKFVTGTELVIDGGFTAA